MSRVKRSNPHRRSYVLESRRGSRKLPDLPPDLVEAEAAQLLGDFGQDAAEWFALRMGWDFSPMLSEVQQFWTEVFWRLQAARPVSRTNPSPRPLERPEVVSSEGRDMIRRPSPNSAPERFWSASELAEFQASCRGGVPSTRGSDVALLDNTLTADITPGELRYRLATRGVCPAPQATRGGALD